jgi:hypothetical protein
MVTPLTIDGWRDGERGFRRLLGKQPGDFLAGPAATPVGVGYQAAASQFTRGAMEARMSRRHLEATVACGVFQRERQTFSRMAD